MSSNITTSSLPGSQQDTPGYSSWESLWKVYFVVIRAITALFPPSLCCFWLTPCVVLCVIFIVTSDSLSGGSVIYCERQAGFCQN